MLPHCRPIINGPWDTPLVPTVTVLTPSPTAIAPFLASRNTTLPAFLQNKAAVNAFVAAHIVPGRRLWRPDFMNLALLRGSNELSVNGTYASFGQEVLQMMGGGTFGVRTNLQVGVRCAGGASWFGDGSAVPLVCWPVFSPYYSA